MMKFIELIENWCRSKESFSFFLPDGPEGRPFDNSYQVVGISEYGDGVAIRLSEGVQFIFEGDIIFERRLVI